jgi:hypothetical protein
MKALYKPSAQPGFELTERPEPVAGPGEVKIRVLRTGICGTDLHIESWDAWAAGAVNASRNRCGRRSSHDRSGYRSGHDRRCLVRVGLHRSGNRLGRSDLLGRCLLRGCGFGGRGERSAKLTLYGRLNR